jgi:hypothetical protein
METVNDINEILISAHSTRHSFIYNLLAVVTLHLSTFFLTSHYDKVCSCDLCVVNVLNRKFVQEMRRLKRMIEEMNTRIYNPVGLNILWPRNVAFLFVRVFPQLPCPCAQHYYLHPSLVSWKLNTMCVVYAPPVHSHVRGWLTIFVSSDPFIMIPDTFHTAQLLYCTSFRSMLSVHIDSLIGQKGKYWFTHCCRGQVGFCKCEEHSR